MILTFLILAFYTLLHPKFSIANPPLNHLFLQSYKPSSNYSFKQTSILGTSTSASSKPLPPQNKQTYPPQDAHNRFLIEPTIVQTSTKIPPIGGLINPITIAILGDSMIDTLKPNIPQLASALRKYYPNKFFKILNYGYGASNIEFGLFRLTHNYQYLNKNIPSLISQNPDLIIIESFAYNNFGNSQQGIDRHWLGLGAITSIIKQKSPDANILLASTIAPNSIIFGNGIPGINWTGLEKIEKSNTIKLYLQNTINFATSQNFPLANAYNPSLLNNEGNPNLISKSDSLHPSTTGAQFFCDILAKSIFDNKLI